MSYPLLLKRATIFQNLFIGRCLALDVAYSHAYAADLPRPLKAVLKNQPKR